MRRCRRQIKTPRSAGARRCDCQSQLAHLLPAYLADFCHLLAGLQVKLKMDGLATLNVLLNIYSCLFRLLVRFDSRFGSGVSVFVSVFRHYLTSAMLTIIRSRQRINTEIKTTDKQINSQIRQLDLTKLQLQIQTTTCSYLLCKSCD